jgi:hypothetical protein
MKIFILFTFLVVSTGIFTGLSSHQGGCPVSDSGIDPTAMMFIP